MAQSNPIQQRIEQLGEMWNDALKNPEVKVVLFRMKKNEEDMIETFFDYMLGVDTDIPDIAIQFQTPINRLETFSRELVEELAVTVNEWNTADKSKDFPFTAIHWTPDLANSNDKNPASLFVQNINSFTNQLKLEEGVYVAPILFLHTSNVLKAENWISKMLEAGLHPRLRVLISDTIENPLFNTCIEKYPSLISVINPELNMPQAMEQLAAMGNPNDPETQYRMAFMKLTNAVAAKKEGDVKEHSSNCIRIATENVDKNPYWIGQIMAVYFTLGIYKVGLKEFGEAIGCATLALKAALAAEGKLNNEMSFRNIGQAAMFRGSLYCQQKIWDNAMDDFNIANVYYGNCKDYVLQIEALRMKAYAAKKYGMLTVELNCLVAGAKLGTQINSTIAKASSYRLLLQSLLLTNFHAALSFEELTEIVVPLFGENWQERMLESTAVSQ